MKALVGAFNQEKALVGAFSVIVQLHRLIDLRHYYYVLFAFGCNNLTIKQCGDKWIAWISNFIVERGLFYKCVQFMFIECWPWLGQTMNIYTLIYQSVANTKLLLQIFSYGQQQTLESSVYVCDNLSFNTSHKSLDSFNKFFPNLAYIF